MNRVACLAFDSGLMQGSDKVKWILGKAFGCGTALHAMEMQVIGGRADLKGKNHRGMERGA